MVAAEGPAVAVIPEFTSRSGDPHIHVHSVVSSKVFEPMTQRWLALDARPLKMDQRALSGAFAVGLEAELTARLGVDFGDRIYTYGRTINGIDRSVVEAMSTRAGQVEGSSQAKYERFVAETGNEPTPQQMFRMEREAQRETRDHKTPELLNFGQWQQHISDVSGLPAGELARTVTGHDADDVPLAPIELRKQAALGLSLIHI